MAPHITQRKKQRQRTAGGKLRGKASAECNVVAIIGARGGSKGLPRKNIRELAGKPLIAWTIEAAKNCSLVDRIIVSTDDDEIAQVARAYGAEVPFKRPAELAADLVPSIQYVKHAVQWLESEAQYPVHIVLYMQVTDVFRKQYMLDEVIGRLRANPGLETVLVGYPTHKNFWMKTGAGFQRVAERGELPRQVKEPVFRDDRGLACATRVEVIRRGKLIGEHVDIVENDDFSSSIDIHSEFDLWLAELMLAEGKASIND